MADKRTVGDVLREGGTITEVYLAKLYMKVTTIRLLETGIRNAEVVSEQLE